MLPGKCFYLKRMKKLKDIVAELENEIARSKPEELPQLYIALCPYLTFVSTDKQQQYLDKIFENPALHAEHPIRLEAQLIQASLFIYRAKIDEAIELINQVLSKIPEQTHKELVADAKQQMSLALLYSGKGDEACALSEQAVAIAKETGDDELICNTYTSASFCFTDKDLAQAGDYALQALHHAKQTGKNWLVGFATYHLGWWAMGNKIDEDAYQYFKTACELLKPEGADEYYAIVLNALSQRQKDKGEFENAIASILEAKEIFLRNNNSRMVILSTYSLGRVYRSSRKFEQAEQCYKEALQMATAENILEEVATVNGFIAFLYRDMGLPEKAIHYLEKAKEIWGGTIRATLNSDINKHLHLLYNQVGDYQKAYQTHVEYAEARFKLQDENRVKENARMQTKYETEKREAELREIKLQQTESELKAIKAQMNPHFIFNALNSIQEMFFIGDKRLANEHLGKFSQLTREILKASGKQFISLNEEIEMLTKYLELEGLRFEKDFSFSIKLNDENAADDILLPPMLIQPYIENAIRHGLLHKKGEKKIEISFVFDEAKKLLTGVIEDNGIGRNAAAEINKNRSQLHESFSTSANAKRLELLNQNREEKIGVQYHDLENGTKVSILIPVAYD